MTFHLSTMWMQNRATSVGAWWEMVAPLGYDGIELSHIVTPAMLVDAEPGAIPVGSIHYPAPMTPHPAVPRNADELLSSPDLALREWAVEQGRRTIDLAAAMGASAVCLHAGSIDMPGRFEWVLRQRYLGGDAGAPVYEEALSALLAARSAAAGPNFSAMRRSLYELARFAETAGVHLGIETRLHVSEIPNLDEAAILLGEHDPDIVGLWLDVGHVQVQAHLGLPALSVWIERFAPRIVGAHLHDTLGLRDHLLPGKGSVDFDLVAASLPSAAVRVLELDWYHTPVEIQAARQTLARTFAAAQP